MGLWWWVIRRRFLSVVVVMRFDFTFTLLYLFLEYFDDVET